MGVPQGAPRKKTLIQEPGDEQALVSRFMTGDYALAATQIPDSLTVPLNLYLVSGLHASGLNTANGASTADRTCTLLCHPPILPAAGVNSCTSLAEKHARVAAFTSARTCQTLRIEGYVYYGVNKNNKKRTKKEHNKNTTKKTVKNTLVGFQSASRAAPHLFKPRSCLTVEAFEGLGLKGCCVYGSE